MIAQLRGTAAALLLLVACDAPAPAGRPASDRPDASASARDSGEPETPPARVAVPPPAPTTDTSSEPVHLGELPVRPPSRVSLLVPEKDGDARGLPARQLRALVSARGRVPVIVGVRVPWRPEGELKGEAALRDQRRRVTAAVDGLVARIGGPGLTVKAAWPSLPFVALRVDASGLDRLLADPEVTSIEHDVAVPPQLDQSVRQIGGDVAWAAGVTGVGQAVAVLDTGVDPIHPFLAGKVVAEGCYSTSDAVSGVYSLCPGGALSSTAPGSGIPCGDSIDGCFHGTHVAGIAAGLDVTYSGVAKGADVVALQVFTLFTDPIDCPSGAPCVRSYSSDQLGALDRVVTLVQGGLPIAAANLSLGSGLYTDACDSLAPSIKAAFDNLISVGTAPIVSSGNDGASDAISYPACLSNAVSVGAVTKADVVDTSYANSDTLLLLLAPGSEIASAYPGGYIVTASGTSMAAPHVSGAWALLKQRRPNLTVAEGLALLQSTGAPIVDSRNGLVRPRIRVDAAVDAVGVDAPQLSPPPGEYATAQTVVITSPTPGSTLRYTTDGTVPSATVGTLAVSPAAVPLSTSTTLRAAASLPGLGTAVTTGRYDLTSAITTTLVPSGAVAAGARWRAVGSTADTFEDGALTRFAWTLSGNGSWATQTALARAGRHAVRSPAVSNSQSATLSVTFESDGGNLTFWYRVSSEAVYDTLKVRIDGVDQRTWSGEIGWTQASLPVAAGTRTVSFVWTKDGSVSVGADAAWIDDVVLPGDQWRASGTTLRGLTASSATVRFRDAGTAWVTPADQVVPLASLVTATVTGTYTEKRVAGVVFSPVAGTYTSAQSVALSTTTPGATIRYTTNGAVPTASSPAYTTPISVPVGSSVTIRAFATLLGWVEAPETSGTWTVLNTVAAPTATPSPGTFTTAQDVRLATTTPGAEVRYTTDGSAPTAASTLHTGPIRVAAGVTTRIRAIGVRAGWASSAELDGTWEVVGTLASPTATPAPGAYTTAQDVVLATTSPEAEIRYTTDGSAPTASSTPYAGPIRVPLDSTTRIRAIAVRTGWTTSSELDATWVVTGTVAAPTATPAPGTYTAPLDVRLASTTPGAVIRYTTDGSAPTASSPVYGGPIRVGVDSALLVRALATRVGWETSAATAFTWVVTGTVAAPILTPAPGTYTSAQVVDASCATAGATIRYTLDGSEPTADSAAWSGPLALGLASSTRLRVRAFRDAWLPSPTTDGTYDITGEVSAPSFDLPPGTYDRPRTLSIVSATPGSVVRYTLDGSAPTEVSPAFTAPLSLGLGTTRVRARAYRTSWAPSPEVSDTWVVVAPLSLARTGAPGAGDVVESGSTATLLVSGGVGPFSLDPVLDAHGVEASSGVVGRDATVEAPTTGAFAGRYVVRVRDTSTGWTAELPLVVPPRIEVEPAALLGLETAQVRVRGARPGVAVSLAVVDGLGAVDTAGALGTLAGSAVPVDAATDGNPATADLTAADVASPASLRIRAVVDGVEGVSSEVSVAPRPADTDAEETDSDASDSDPDAPETDAVETDEPALPDDTDVETDTDAGGDGPSAGGCGCASTGSAAGGWAAGLLVGLGALRRRGRSGSSRPEAQGPSQRYSSTGHEGGPLRR